MTTFQVIDAKPYHVGAILHRMRHEHRDAIVSLGLNAHRELRMVFDASSFRRAWLIDGKLAALGGMTGSIAETYGWVWLVLAQEAMRFPGTVVREARRQLAEMMQTRSELTTTVLSDDAGAKRLALFLGFHVPEGPFDRAADGRSERQALARLIADGAPSRVPLAPGKYATLLGYHEAA